MQLSLRLLLVFILLAGFSCAPKPGPAEKASELVQAWMEETHAVGVTVSVGRDGEIIWSQGFGYADLEQDVPVDPGKTLFRVGSVAKSMTATAVGILYEAGKLDLDAPVQTYVPGFPQKQGVITPRLLGGHIAGIRHYQGDENLSNVPYDSVTASLAIFKDDPLLHAPGSKYHYSSYGFNLLSAVVEGA
ncbi:MAG: beta-lactamase family protein [Verrucomicrobiae bacterium]|nr:beta-lactamase family protein [Verrucomicrobiae bacterium]